jgi:hypothetical protein
MSIIPPPEIIHIASFPITTVLHKNNSFFGLLYFGTLKCILSLGKAANTV